MNVKIFVCVYSNKLKNIYTLDFSNCKMIPNENKAWNFESLTDKFITQNLVDGIFEQLLHSEWVYCLLFRVDGWGWSFVLQGNIRVKSLVWILYRNTPSDSLRKSIASLIFVGEKDGWILFQKCEENCFLWRL